VETGRVPSLGACSEVAMRVPCGILAGLLLVFAAVQWNDPDPVFWAAAYGAGAAWCGFAAFSPRMLGRAPARALSLPALGCALWGVAAFWPDSERWWSVAVWWPERSGEAAREGMGMMVLALAMTAAALAGRDRA
jgi:Transmembrane family 220, helix